MIDSSQAVSQEPPGWWSRGTGQNIPQLFKKAALVLFDVSLEEEKGHLLQVLVLKSHVTSDMILTLSTAGSSFFR